LLSGVEWLVRAKIFAMTNTARKTPGPKAEQNPRNTDGGGITVGGMRGGFVSAYAAAVAGTLHLLGRGCTCQPGTCRLGQWAWCDKRGRAARPPYSGSSYTTTDGKAAHEHRWNADACRGRSAEAHRSISDWRSGLAADSVSGTTGRQQTPIPSSMYLLSRSALSALIARLQKELETMGTLHSSPGQSQ